MFFLAVGYATFSTTISLHAKGNVYPTISIDDLKGTVVTSGDGLYDNGDGSYTYKGGSPANYLKLGNDIYRIMEIESDNKLKVIKEDSMILPLDLGYSSSINGITSNSSINGTRYSSESTDYCYLSSESEYRGCNSWGSASTTLDSNGNNVTTRPLVVGDSTTLRNLPKYDSYLNVYLNGGRYLTTSSSGNSNTYQEITGWIEGLSYKSLIEEHSFDIGTIATISNQTLAEDISQAHAYTWKGKVGLITAIDYVKASTNSECTGVYAYYQNSACYNNGNIHNYLIKTNSQWTMSSYSYSYPYREWHASTTNLGSDYPYDTIGVCPIIYLKSNIRLMGTGNSISSAYTVVSR